MIRAREPKELFAAHSAEAWDGWVEFFSGTREPDARRKGTIEVIKKMYHLWEELEEYYRMRLSEAPEWEPTEQPVETACPALSARGGSAKP